MYYLKYFEIYKRKIVTNQMKSRQFLYNDRKISDLSSWKQYGK